jgi:poly-gamma-glutamate synthesis protein (capsule biosynthesis protein)
MPGGSNKRWLGLIVAVIALIAIIAIVVNVVSCATNSQEPQQNDEVLAASDTEAPEATTITLSFAGDCTLGTDANFDQSTSFTTKYEAVDDPSYFFANVADIFANDDATIVNMEGTLTTSTTRADKTYAFKASADYAQILVDGNVEAASLANNHSHDYGDQSYTDTIEAVEAAGIPTFGYDRIAYLDVKGVKVALIGTYELAEGIGIKDEMVSNINTAKEAGAQIIAVYTHWGTEKETVPDSTQMELGHAAIDAGATIVIGSHPHVIQGVEEYNGRYIVYSLGNFCFGGNKNPSDKDCMIFQQTFTVQGSDVALDENTNIIPCSISSSSSTNNYQPTPATGSEKERIMAKIEDSSSAIAEMAATLTSS